MNAPAHGAIVDEWHSHQAFRVLGCLRAFYLACQTGLSAISAVHKKRRYQPNTRLGVHRACRLLSATHPETYAGRLLIIHQERRIQYGMRIVGGNGSDVSGNRLAVARRLVAHHQWTAAIFIQAVQRAMAFADDYTVLGTSKDKVKQLGNAVTPPAMEWLVQQAVKSLS